MSPVVAGAGEGAPLIGQPAGAPRGLPSSTVRLDDPEEASGAHLIPFSLSSGPPGRPEPRGGDKASFLHPRSWPLGCILGAISAIVLVIAMLTWLSAKVSGAQRTYNCPGDLLEGDKFFFVVRMHGPCKPKHT